jgi:hypothetical protein
VCVRAIRAFPCLGEHQQRRAAAGLVEWTRPVGDDARDAQAAVAVGAWGPQAWVNLGPGPVKTMMKSAGDRPIPLLES